MQQDSGLLLAADGLNGFLPAVGSNSSTNKASSCVSLISCSSYILRISSLGLMCVRMSLDEGALLLMAGSTQQQHLPCDFAFNQATSLQVGFGLMEDMVAFATSCPAAQKEDELFVQPATMNLEVLSWEPGGILSSNLLLPELVYTANNTSLDHIAASTLDGAQWCFSSSLGDSSTRGFTPTTSSNFFRHC